MLILYRLSIWLYAMLIRCISPFHTKAKKFVEGRRNWKNQLSNALEGNTSQIIWFHAASLGEFEQGRPVIERLKQEHRDIKVLLTFFSPSGYEIRKDYQHADWVFYLPVDSPRNAQFFIDTIQPKVVVFIKYEFWYSYLKALKSRQIPTIMISCVFRESQFFFHWAGSFYRRVLKTIDHYFVQDQKSVDLVTPIIGEKVTKAGDTRFDRVITIAGEKKDIPEIADFKGTERLIVLGSTWQSDIEKLNELIISYSEKLKFVIAPHNITEAEISKIESAYTNTIRFSKATGSCDISENRILIVDNMGMLSSIYAYGDFAFIGGGFRGALHNTLEAAVYSIPVFFGEHPNNQKFREAIQLVENGGGFTFITSEELLEQFEQLQTDEDKYRQTCTSAYDFVQSRSGATDLIMTKLNQLLE